MSQADLILIHAPNVYDFRKLPFLYGPISDLVPSTPVFEMYPIGLASIAEYVERFGYHARIVNLASRMLRDNDFDVDKFLARLEAPLFGIDLHWLVHAQGAIEIAKRIKDYHPNSKVVLGGISSSYYYREILSEHAEIDYVIRGDSSEEPMKQLLEAVKGGATPDDIPNLVWRDSQGNIKENPFTYVPDTIDDFMHHHYTNVVRSVLRYLDLSSTLPTREWMSYPITAVITCRGCNHNCLTCGGSRTAYEQFMGRKKLAIRSPEMLVSDIHDISSFTRGPIVVLGDVRELGAANAETFLSQLENSKVKNQLLFEIFRPASKKFFQALDRSAPGFCMEISPETHDEAIRKQIGRNYSNKELENSIASVLSTNCRRLDIYFMIGLPGQDASSVMETIDYCAYLIDKFPDKRLSLFIGPLAPFLDPGSIAFENPEKYGYKLLAHSLEEHRQALLGPSWQFTLNYETKWLGRRELVNVSYEAIRRLTELKAKANLVSPELAKTQEKRIDQALFLEEKLAEGYNPNDGYESIMDLKEEIDKFNRLEASERQELKFRLPFNRIRFLNSLRQAMRSSRG